MKKGDKMTDQVGPEISQKTSTQPCPLCSREDQMPQGEMLYGHLICERCFRDFANRRQLAYLIDFGLWCVVFLLFLLIAALFKIKLNWGEILGFGCVWLLMFAFKDGFGGQSPGKALLGLQVIHEESGKPIGMAGSFKRNLPILIPLLPIFLGLDLCKGHRVGDAWSHSKVIWKKYSILPVFLFKSSPEYVVTDETRQEEGRKLLAKAAKLTARGKNDEAIKVYEQIISNYRMTQVARDAETLLNNLLKTARG